MSDLDTELESELESYEAGVADLVSAYEAAEAPYFAAVAASTPVVPQYVASNSSAWVPDADVG